MVDILQRKITEGIYRFEHVPCDLCGESKFILMGDTDRYGLYYPVVKCEECGLIQANPRMTASSYRKFYVEDYRRIYKTHNSILEHFKFLTRKGRRILKFIDNSVRGLSVLEIGCSSGGILQTFKNNGAKVTGYDYDATYVNFGKKRRLNLHVGDITDVHGQYDIAIYSMVLEHVLSPTKEVVKVHSVLKDKGLLFVDVPDTERWMEQGSFIESWQNAHMYHYTQRTLMEIMNKGHFTRIKQLTYDGKNSMTLWRKN